MKTVWTVRALLKEMHKREYQLDDVMSVMTNSGEVIFVVGAEVQDISGARRVVLATERAVTCQKKSTPKSARS